MLPVEKRPKTYFKYVTAEVAKIILINHKLRWSSPLLFNDPFDVQRDFNLGFEIEDIIKPVVQETIKLIYKRITSGIQSTSIVEKFVKLLKESNSEERDKILSLKIPKFIFNVMRIRNEETKKQWAKFIPEFRILCLSEIYDNLLMWSHYSDSHKGAVLELQTINKFDSPWLIAQPIVYQDSPTMLATKQEWIKHLTSQKLINVHQWKFYDPCVLTKKTDWQYEKEWRVVSFARSGETGLYTDYPFNPEELRAIYLGCDMLSKDIEDITSLIKYDLSHVHIFRGKKIESKRELFFERIKP